MQTRFEFESKQRILAAGLTAYGSGANHVADIRGQVKAGIPVGVDVSELSENAVCELEALAGRGVPVFVDSGAFGEMLITANGLEVGQEITPAEWRRRLDIYRRLGAALGSQLTVVAPDRVGDQTVTLERLRTYAADLQGLKAAGVEIVIPVQFGEMSEGHPDEFYFLANDAAGFDVVRPESRDKVFTDTSDYDTRLGMAPALPMKKAACDIQDAAFFVRQVRPHRVHCLGLGAANPRAAELVKVLQAIDANLEISMDANLIRSNVGQGRGITEAQAAGLGRVDAIAVGLDSHRAAGQFEVYSFEVNSTNIQHQALDQVNSFGSTINQHGRKHKCQFTMKHA
jgi:hypothetical protein